MTNNNGVVTTADAAVASPDFALPAHVSKIAFGSCHKTKYFDRQIWDTLRNERPDVFAWTGDAAYPPVRGVASVELLDAEYERTRGDAAIGYRDFLFQQQPPLVFGTWDDHDYGGNDRGHDLPDKRARAAAYWRFLNRTAPPDHREGLYYSVANDRVKIVFLDTRWHRQHHCVPSVAGKVPLGAGLACLTRWLSAGLAPEYCSKNAKENDNHYPLLGREQWQWFEQELARGSHQVILVVSSIQVLTTNPVMESWGHFPTERDRLIRLLLSKRQNGSNSVVITVLSGDVHHGEILDPFPSQRQYGDFSGAFLEVTSSGLTHDCSAHAYGALCRPLLEVYHGHRFRGGRATQQQQPWNDDDDKKKSKKDYYYIGRNYGTVNIDWEAETVTVQVHDVADGAVVLTTGARSFAKQATAPTAHQWSEDDVASVLPCMDGHLIPLAWTAALAFAVALVLSRTLVGRRKKR